MPTSSAQSLAVQFRDINDFLHAGGAPATARQRLVDLTSSVIPGCDWAAITTWPPNVRPRTVASSDDIARAVDELQYEVGDGPCLAATRTREPVWSPDLAAESRWPQFCVAARDRSAVRGVVSYHLTDEPTPAALNLYSSRADALNAEAVAAGALFATHASVLMAHADSAHQAATLGVALTTSRQIGASLGILMAAHRITEDQAFALLKQTSSHLNRKLRDIARDVTDTGELPSVSTQRHDGTA